MTSFTVFLHKPELLSAKLPFVKMKSCFEKVFKTNLLTLIQGFKMYIVEKIGLAMLCM